MCELVCLRLCNGSVVCFCDCVCLYVYVKGGMARGDDKQCAHARMLVVYDNIYREIIA